MSEVRKKRIATEKEKTAAELSESEVRTIITVYGKHWKGWNRKKRKRAKRENTPIIPNQSLRAILHAGQEEKKIIIKKPGKTAGEKAGLLAFSSGGMEKEDQPEKTEFSQEITARWKATAERKHGSEIEKPFENKDETELGTPEVKKRAALIRPGDSVSYEGRRAENGASGKGTGQRAIRRIRTAEQKKNFPIRKIDKRKQKDAPCFQSKRPGIRKIAGEGFREGKRGIKSKMELVEAAGREQEPGKGDAGNELVKIMAKDLASQARHVMKQAKNAVVLVISILFGPIAGIVAGIGLPVILLVLLLSVMAFFLIIGSFFFAFAFLFGVVSYFFSPEYEMTTTAPMYQYAMKKVDDFYEDMQEEKSKKTEYYLNGEEADELEDLRIRKEEIYLVYLAEYEKSTYLDTDLQIEQDGEETNLDDLKQNTWKNRNNFDAIFSYMYSIEETKDKCMISMNDGNEYWNQKIEAEKRKIDNYELFYEAVFHEQKEISENARALLQMLKEEPQLQLEGSQ